MKKIITFLFPVLIFMLLVTFVFYNYINYENRNFKSHYSYISGKNLKSIILESKKNTVCVIISPTCSGVSFFMPKVSKNLNKLSDSTRTYFIVNMLNRKDVESILDSVLLKYKVNNKPFIIDFSKHKRGSLFDPKNKYSTFLSDLCDSCNDSSLGYPLYIYFKNGKYFDKSYFFNDSIYNEIK